ncbi:BnaC09g39900D [Brassica napus]|uniref:BnaC09g39900D protein n=1 Tax=Brassica napus TaxID=3708 RepID=A0A078GG77_BRANA|nr:BnaC09g39900D [Brassica napus]
MGREIVRRQSVHEPGKRQFLIDAQEIYDVLADETGTGSVLGISFNMSETSELYLGEGAFSGMHNLQILRFYKQWSDKARLHLLEGLDCLPLPRKLKLLHWEACPMKHMPFRFRPECLIEINMKESKLRKLWEGVPMLRSLKKMDLSYSISLDELPDLSEAIFLNHLDLRNCESLVRLPSSIWKLGWLKFLHLHYCINLEPLPANNALSSLSYLSIGECSKIVDFPEISSSIERLDVSFTAIAAVPPSVENWDCLRKVEMIGCENITEFPRFSYTVTKLHLQSTGIKEIPPWISDLYELKVLDCRELESLPELPDSLSELYADNCVSLERLSQSSRSPHDPKLILSFINCSNLDEEACELVIKQWACGYAVLPGSEVPYCFSHRANGSSLIIHLNPGNLYGSLRFKACVVHSPGDELDDVPFRSFQISCYVRGRHSTTVYKWPEIDVDKSNDPLLEDHLFIFNSYFTLDGDNIPESEMLFDFRCLGMKVYPDTVSSNILECGVQLLEPCSCKYDRHSSPRGIDYSSQGR